MKKFLNVNKKKIAASVIMLCLIFTIHFNLFGTKQFIYKTYPNLEIRKDYFSKKSIVENESLDVLKNTSVIFRNIIFLYKIYTAYINFIKNLYSKNDIINYKYYIDLISRPNENIFKNGMNILIFNEQDINMICNPYLLNKIHTSIFFLNFYTE